MRHRLPQRGQRRGSHEAAPPNNPHSRGPGEPATLHQHCSGLGGERDQQPAVPCGYPPPGGPAPHAPEVRRPAGRKISSARAQQTCSHAPPPRSSSPTPHHATIAILLPLGPGSPLPPLDRSLRRSFRATWPFRSVARPRPRMGSYLPETYDLT
ncbi:hypothetical protein NDU88_000171 [Pleurodeles waltl]|uniref:Uncharacterized protein n=1 Tax=Pleurodeles waltl TaxID=8319 RepID=A0AAV7L5M8_PLEWA|nr:hypothetical protein NDU88_000171 [Pleurodeles waltl]